ncbi:hypothetical protein JTB14_018731 [Gonioctena quinquepunctata]|nr:hypothetical protein JTB14_018731 [Gonioctena quinquepunctata]
MKIIIQTDHKALSFLLNCSLLNSRLTRWILSIQRFSFKIIHISGKENKIADILSRNPLVEDESKPRGPEVSIAELSLICDKEITTYLKEISVHQRNDSRLQNHLQHEKKGLYFTKYNDIIFAKRKSDMPWKIYLPKSLIETSVEKYHSQYGHFGVSKTLKFIEYHFIWENMKRDISKIIRRCNICQQAKVPNRTYTGEQMSIIPEDEYDLLAVDFYGPLPSGQFGMKYIFVVLNVFTKYVVLYTMRNATTKGVLNQLLKDYFINVSRTKRIISDRGTQFTSSTFVESMKREGVKVMHSSVRHPEGNPVERVMRELGRLFRTYCYENHKSWVPKINCWLHLVTHESTGFSAFELQTGRKPRDEIKKIIEFPEESNENEEKD